MNTTLKAALKNYPSIRKYKMLLESLSKNKYVPYQFYTYVNYRIVKGLMDKITFNKLCKELLLWKHIEEKEFE